MFFFDFDVIIATLTYSLLDAARCFYKSDTPQLAETKLSLRLQSLEVIQIDDSCQLYLYEVLQYERHVIRGWIPIS